MGYPGIKRGSENEIQADYFAEIALHRRKHPQIEMIHAIPNGAHKSKIARVVYSLTGLKSGVPDVFVPSARCGFHGLYIEFKTKIGRLTENQKWFIAKLKAEGYLVATCRTSEEAVSLTLGYLSGTLVLTEADEVG